MCSNVCALETKVIMEKSKEKCQDRVCKDRMRTDQEDMARFDSVADQMPNRTEKNSFTLLYFFFSFSPVSVNVFLNFFYVWGYNYKHCI